MQYLKQICEIFIFFFYFTEVKKTLFLETWASLQFQFKSYAF